MPAMGRVSSRMTAAANTGPASGPRPASSTPASRPSEGATAEKRGICMSVSLLKNGLRRQCAGIAFEHMVQADVAIVQRGTIGAVCQGFPARSGECLGGGGVLEQFGHDKLPGQNIGQAYPWQQRLALA